MSNFKKIYDFRFYIFTIRFFPLFFTVVLVFSYIIPQYGYLHSYTLYGIVGIGLSWLFSEIWVRFKAKLIHAQKLYDEGKINEVYKIYNDLQSETLWARESFTLDLHRAKLFLIVGNYKRFLNLLDNISLKIEKYPKEEFFYRLLKAFYYEIKNEWQKAIDELENIYETTNDDYYKLQASNNIARIEEFLDHPVSAKSSYEKAYRILKQKPNARYFPIVIHNLLIIYAKSNELDKGTKLLKEYYQLINKKNSIEIIQYANDMTHYAREIQDKKLLKKSYKIIQNDVMTLLDNNEKITLEINELRMRYNDNLEFNKYFKIIFEKIKSQKDAFLLMEKLNILRELRHVLFQKLQTTKHPNNIEWVENFRWCTKWNLSLKIEIEESLKNIESSLTEERIFWINQLVQLQKAKMTIPKVNKPFEIEDLKLLSKYIEEMISIWKDAKNEIKEVYEIFHFIDEITSYFKQTQDLRIIQKFNEKVTNYLLRVDMLLEKHWQRPDIGELIITLAHFFLILQNNKELAKKWINRFDSKNISLNKYAKFISIQYNNVKQQIN